MNQHLTNIVWGAAFSLLWAGAIAASGCAEGTTLVGVGGEGGDESSGSGFGGMTGASTSTSGVSSSSSTGSSMTTTSSSGSGASSSSSGNPGSCNLNRLLISEVRSRGANGATDEFIELFNASSTFITLDSNWSIEGRSAGGAGYTTRWKAASGTIPAFGHFLIAPMNSTVFAMSDSELTSSITDAASLRLMNGSTVVDAVCYYYSAGTMAAFTADYTCEGTPVSNLPHNDSADPASTVDVSIERLPTGNGGNCVDTGDNASDWINSMPATPRNSQSPPTP